MKERDDFRLLLSKNDAEKSDRWRGKGCATVSVPGECEINSVTVLWGR